MQKNEKIAAYFDFDGTLTTRDTFIPFLLHAAGAFRFLVMIPYLIPFVVLYFLKIIDNEQLKQKTLTCLIKGYSLVSLEKKAKSFAYTKISRYIKPEVFAKLEYHKEHGHKVILVSANLALYLRHWAQIHELDDVIATELEFIDGKATGKLGTRNCYGMQKTFRINAYLENKHIAFDYSYAYGNSAGDYQMLDYADEGYWIDDTLFSLWKRTESDEK